MKMVSRGARSGSRQPSGERTSSPSRTAPALSATYTQIRRLRSTGDWHGAMSTLRSHVPTSDYDAYEAVTCLFLQDNLDDAMHVCRTYAWNTKWGTAAAEAIVAAFGRGDAEHALRQAGLAAHDATAPSDVVAMFLVLLVEAGLAQEARAFVSNRLPELPHGETFLLSAIAQVAAGCKQWRLAAQAACAVLTVDPDEPRALLILSTANFEIGNFHEALGNALRAAGRSDAGPEAVVQIMRCRNRLGQFYGAIAAYEPLRSRGYARADIHIELAHAYSGLGDRERAVAEFRAALNENTEVEALRGLAMAYAFDLRMNELSELAGTQSAAREDPVCNYWHGIAALNSAEFGEATRLFRRSHELTRARGSENSIRRPPSNVRIRHDVEQLELLTARGLLPPEGRTSLEVLKRYDSAADPAQPLGHAGIPEPLQRALDAVLYEPPGAFAGTALGQNDYAAVEAHYREQKIAVIDDFLTDDALRALRAFCEEATIWKSDYDTGYVGTELARGFCPEVLLKLSQELREVMPGLLGHLPLTQAWAFKYDQRLSGIKLHADFALVNVNFWITPDDACQDREHGGMVVYDIPVPKSWTFYEYNHEPEKLDVYLKVHGGTCRRVPYRQNRCVIFDSSLIHKTDDLSFRPGYENRRVNVTLLYGVPRTIGTAAPHDNASGNP